MKKATARKYFVREIHGNTAEIINARQEISRGKGSYGINWKFKEVDKNEFLEELEKDEKVLCIETLSGKYVEVDKNDINKFNL